MEELYSRQMRLPELGLDGQKKLAQSSILVVGVGGLGCAALPSLAAVGIGRIGLADFDCVELSNLPRQMLFGKHDVGQLKVDVAEKRLASLYPDTLFEKHPCRIENEELFHSYDIILDATDNSEARYAINDACRALNKSWIYGSIDQWEGQVALFTPPNDYRALFPAGPAEHEQNCATGGVLGAFVNLVGSIQALEAIKHLLGLETLVGKLLLIDGKNWRTTLVTTFKKQPLPPLEISYATMAAWMNKGDMQLVDVREPEEKIEGDLGGLLNPFTRFSIDLLETGKKIVLYCRSGYRSNVLAERLRQTGFDAYSLSGGILQENKKREARE